MLPWLLLVAVLDLVIVALDRMPVARRGVVDSLVVGLLATSAAAAGVAFALEGTAAALLILVPAYHAGTRFGRFGFLLTSATGSVAYLLAVAGQRLGGGHRPDDARVARRGLAARHPRRLEPAAGC